MPRTAPSADGANPDVFHGEPGARGAGGVRVCRPHREDAAAQSRIAGVASILSSATRSKEPQPTSAAGESWPRLKRFIADPKDRDAALLLDMLLAARDARSFVEGVEAAFRASRLHHNAVIRSLEIIGEAVGRVPAEGRQRSGRVSERRDHDPSPAGNDCVNEPVRQFRIVESRTRRVPQTGRRAAGKQSEPGTGKREVTMSKVSFGDTAETIDRAEHDAVSDGLGMVCVVRGWPEQRRWSPSARRS